jgi:hypothetical protein
MCDVTIKTVCGIWLAAITCFGAGSEDDWHYFTTGKLPIHFKSYRRNTFPAGIWASANGIIRALPAADRVDLTTRERFTNFEFSVEYQLPERGSSGILYLVQEGARFADKASLKFTLVSPVAGASGDRDGTRQLGSLYGLLAATGAEANPAGQWNECRIRVLTNHVEHWLNGTRVLEFDLTNTNFTALLEEKQTEFSPEAASRKGGFIAFQHEGSEVRYRLPKIRILTVPDKPAAPPAN